MVAIIIVLKILVAVLLLIAVALVVVAVMLTLQIRRLAVDSQQNVKAAVEQMTNRIQMRVNKFQARRRRKYERQQKDRS